MISTQVPQLFRRPDRLKLQASRRRAIHRLCRLQFQRNCLRLVPCSAEIKFTVQSSATFFCSDGLVARQKLIILVNLFFFNFFSRKFLLWLFFLLFFLFFLLFSSFFYRNFFLRRLIFNISFIHSFIHSFILSFFLSFFLSSIHSFFLREPH